MIEETVACREAALTGRLSFLNTGTGTAAVQIYGGTRPGSVNSAPGSSPLVTIPLDNPAGAVSSGSLVLDPFAPGLIAVTGEATWARVINRNGATAFDLDAGAVGSAAEVQLSQTQLYAGGSVAIVSATLA
jgi:hypothetical protein